MNYYAGIGARGTPQDILNLMAHIAAELRRHDYILRSGGAKGADTAFGIGAGEQSCIYLTNHYVSNVGPQYRYSDDKWAEATQIARDLHPAWHALHSPYVQGLMIRNTFQLLGENLDTPSEFVLCWTPDGVEHGHDTTQNTGGTGQAIRVASRYGIPVCNLANVLRIDEVLDNINRWNQTGVTA